MGVIYGTPDKIKDQLKADKELARYQADIDKEFWDYTFGSTNEYNSPQAQLDRAKAAGINPNLVVGGIGAYGQSSAGVVGNSGGLVDATPSQAPQLLGNAIDSTRNFMDAIEQSALLGAQRQNIQADTRQKNAAAAQNETETAWIPSMRKANVDELTSRVHLQGEQAKEFGALWRYYNTQTDQTLLKLVPELGTAYQNWINAQVQEQVLRSEEKVNKAVADKTRTDASLNTQLANESAARTEGQHIKNITDGIQAQFRKIAAENGIPIGDNWPMREVRVRATKEGLMSVGADGKLTGEIYGNAEGSLGLPMVGKAGASVGGKLSGSAGVNFLKSSGLTEGQEFTISVPLTIPELLRYAGSGAGSSASSASPMPPIPPYGYNGNGSSWTPSWQ